MRKSIITYTLRMLAITLWLALFTACSTTKRLTENETLYTGVKEMKIESYDGKKLNSEVKGKVKKSLSVPPNNALFSSNSLKFIPTELWAWNYLYTTNPKSFKGWLFNIFAKEPVLIQTVRPDLRSGIAEDILFNNGYFNSTATYTINYDKKNPKKATVSYHVVAGSPYTLDSIAFPNDTTPLADMIRRNSDKSLLYKGQRYNADTLALERERITTILRDSGYYYFRSEYLIYQADTTMRNGKVDLRMLISPSTPTMPCVHTRQAR